MHRQVSTTGYPQRNARNGLLTKNIHDQRQVRARLLDQAATAELFLGHIALAERLSHQADELREARQ